MKDYVIAALGSLAAVIVVVFTFLFVAGAATTTAALDYSGWTVRTPDTYCAEEWTIDEVRTHQYANGGYLDFIDDQGKRHKIHGPFTMSEN